MPLTPAKKLSLVLIALAVVILTMKRMTPDASPSRSSRGDEAHSSALSNSQSLVISSPTNQNNSYVIVGGMTDPFRNRKQSLLNYQLQNVNLTSNGLALADLSQRVGTLESPPLKLKHPAKIISPLWRQQTLNGTSVKIETAFSVDGSNWSRWMPAERDEIFSEQANAATSSEKQFRLPPGVVRGKAFPPREPPENFVRYRVMLETRGEATPLFQEMQFMYESVP